MAVCQLSIDSFSSFSLTFLVLPKFTNLCENKNLSQICNACAALLQSAMLETKRVESIVLFLNTRRMRG